MLLGHRWRTLRRNFYLHFRKHSSSFVLYYWLIVPFPVPTVCINPSDMIVGEVEYPHEKIVIKDLVTENKYRSINRSYYYLQ